MNDADQDWYAARPGSRIAWWQVGVEDNDDPLPIQPLLACVHDSLARVGHVSVDSIQFLLPLQAGGDALRRLSSGTNWLNLSPRNDRTAFGITLDSGSEAGVIDPVAILAALEGMMVDVPLHFERWFSIDESDMIRPIPAVVGELWMGEGNHAVTYRGWLSEWSFDSLGWLTLFVAEACRQNGVNTTLLVSIGKV